MKYCLALDLKDDPGLIEEYKEHHRNVWQEVIEHIKHSGISDMEIFNTGNRLMMIIETSPGFSFDKKRALDEKNEIVRQWEELMDTYQQRLPSSGNQKWVPMDKIFDLNKTDDAEN